MADLDYHPVSPLEHKLKGSVMHTLLTWSVRLILLFILTVGVVIVYYAVKDAFNGVEEHNESH